MYSFRTVSAIFSHWSFSRFFNPHVADSPAKKLSNENNCSQMFRFQQVGERRYVYDMKLFCHSLVGVFESYSSLRFVHL